MSKNKKRILILPGDGIGPEVSVVAKKLLVLLDQKYSLDLEVSEGLLGGIAYDQTGDPLPKETLDKAKENEAILLGAVGGPKWDQISSEKRPEKGDCRHNGAREEYHLSHRFKAFQKGD